MILLVVVQGYTKGDRKLVRKPVEEVYGKEDY